MRQEDIVALSLEDLREQVSVQKTQLAKMKITHAVSPLENPRLIKAAKKTIARLNTEIRKRELAEKA